MQSPQIRRAIISVSNKLGLAGFARGLVDAGVEIYSTGGTRRHLEAEGIPVKDVSEYTGFPEMLGGRVKTLHPKVFAGILCRHDNPEDMDTIAQHGIVPFELVVVNLYPFEATIARPDATEEEAIENIDIGGPSLVRAAAKNFFFTTVVTDPEQYPEVLEQIKANGATTLELRRRLACEAFAHTAKYDQAIASYFSGKWDAAELPPTLWFSMRRKAVLRYGENPHQKAAVYALPDGPGPSIVGAVQLHGKELSYNNYLDLDAAMAIVRMFEQPAAAVIKHTNPCGAAIGSSLADALRKALAGDPVSAFGSVIGLNCEVDEETAKVFTDPNLFVEAIIAPDFSDEAVRVLTTEPKWKKNVRLVKVGDMKGPARRWAYRSIEGGILVQESDIQPDDYAAWKVVTEAQPTDEQLNDLRFAWAVARHVKSNAIVLAKDGMVLGVGAGQMSRVDATDIAIRKAGDRVSGAVLASDAFFPFPDSIEKAAAAGIVAVVQPGGSVRDEEVIAACNKHGLPMIFTGTRHFKH